MALPLPISLTPSKVASFKDCALAFRFSAIDRIPEPPSPHLTKGTLVHRALELLFCIEPPSQRTMSAALDCLDRARTELRDDPDYAGLGLSDDEEAAFVADAETLLRNYFRLEDPAAIHPIGLELRLEVQLGTLRLRGIIDRLELDAGKLVVTDYKGLAIDTPLPTPDGWTTMGEVEPGDLLLGADGRPTRIVEKSQTHWRRCYRITFDDSSTIVCDNEHLWSVKVGTADRAQGKVLNADELFDLWTAGVRPITIPNAAPLDLPEVALPVDPYVLGVWLGDGSSRKGVIHVCASDSDHFMTAFQARGENVSDATSPSERKKEMREIYVRAPRPERCIRGHNDRWPDRPDGRRGDCRSCIREGIPAFPFNGTLSRRLTALGVIGRKPRNGRMLPAPSKHVPTEYLRASRNQRLDLLRGLMDTDGYWNPGRRQAVFTTTNENLARAVEDLVCGLGARAYTYSEAYTVRRGERIKYQVIFTPVAFNPFTLPRKASVCIPSEHPLKAGRRAITDITVVPTVPTQCVAVDAPDSLYLAGRQMVPTHNTGKPPNVKYEQGRLGGVHFYAFLCERLLGRRPDRIQLLYLSGEPLAIVAEPSEQSIRGLEQRTSAIWTAVERACEREDFRPRPSGLCDWCSYRPYCPAWGGDPEQAKELLPLVPA